MEADDPWEIFFVEVASHRVANVFLDLFWRVAFGEDGIAESARGVPAFGCFFDKENQLGTHQRLQAHRNMQEFTLRIGCLSLQMVAIP
jgi:hypothetical protein